MVDVVACVVNWSTPGDLEKLVASAEVHEPGLRWSIYQNGESGVDNGPMLERLFVSYEPNVILNGSSKNEGHGYGINRAVGMAHHMWDPEYVFVVNPDCLFTEPILDRLVDALEEDPVRFTVGPKQIDSLGRVTAGGIIGTMASPKHRIFRSKDDGTVSDRVLCPTVAGSAMLFRAGEFIEFGGLLEARHYYSETWLCYHANTHGRECWYIGDTQMIHEWHQSSIVGHPDTDGRVGEDREMFREACDSHDPPIPHD